MTWHRVWLIKCNGQDCPQGHVSDNPAVDPPGWASDGSNHLCTDCATKLRNEAAEVESDPEELAMVGSNGRGKRSREGVPHG